MACPNVIHTAAKLKYNCATVTMTRGSDDVWPVEFGQSVEDNWQLNEGSGVWGPLAGSTLAKIANTLRQQVIDDGGYGPTPAVQTISDADRTINGHAAHVLQTTFTIDPTYAAQNALKVKTETSWIVVLSTDATNVSAWFVSVPDEAAALVPDANVLINSITVL